MVLRIESYFDEPYATQYCSSSTKAIRMPWYAAPFITTLIFI